MGRCRSNQNSIHVLILTMMEERSTKLGFKPPSPIGTNSPKGSGNDNFFKFALDLRRAGMNKGQIETMLRSEAAFGHSPNERTAQIPSIIKSLQESFRASKQRMP